MFGHALLHREKVVVSSKRRHSDGAALKKRKDRRRSQDACKSHQSLHPQFAEHSDQSPKSGDASPSVLRRQASIRSNSPLDGNAPPIVGRNGVVLKNFANLSTGQVNLIRQSWKVVYTSNVTKHMHRVMSRVEEKYSRTKKIFYTSAFLVSSQLTAREKLALMGRSQQLQDENPPSSFFHTTGAQNNNISPKFDDTINSTAKTLSDIAISNSASRTTSRSDHVNKDGVHTTATFNDHGRLLTKLFDQVIQNLRDCQSAIQVLRLCGARHGSIKNAGMRPEFWEVFGEACLETFQGLDGIQQNKEVCKAWRILIACMTHEIRAGFEEEVRNILHDHRIMTMQVHTTKNE